ncbi:zinc finger MYM-type protein 1-like [Engystomops pustulosus]|uniref:zinc finger MYM-type protein 1-like n=1 Tax=Engystomops pustulosus TaxID=76066 RepID=UPI003AFB1C4D
MDIRSYFPGKNLATRTISQEQGKQNEAQHSSNSATETDEIEDTEPACRSKALTSAVLPSDLGEREKGPMQPKLAQFPFEQYGQRKRSFQYHWFEKHSWLEYSVEQNAAFCFPCRQFGHQQKRYNKDALLSHGGFKNWKRALDSFKEHELSTSHISSTQGWCAFKDYQKHGSIVDQLNIASESQIRERRDYMARLIGIVQFFGRSGIPFHGHDETDGSLNKGNFLECLNLLKTFDPFLQNYSPPNNATYTSPSSQNEILESCADEVIAKLVSNVKKAGMYSVMADEARDGRYRKLLALCVRCVTPENGVPTEHFLGFKELKEFDAQTIAASIENSLREHGLEKILCVAQTYDGAAVMSGISGGVQAKFQENHPEAIYVHCYAHELNLVLCYTCKAVPEAKDFFETLETLYAFFTTSLVHHNKFTDVQSSLGLGASQLVQLSDTRWSCQIRSVKAVIVNYSPVVQCLSEIRSPVAMGLLICMKKLSTVFCLFMFNSLLSTTEGFHRLLQKEDLDLATAVNYKEAVYQTLYNMRTLEKGTEIYNESVALFNANNIPIPEPKAPRRKQKKMDDFVAQATCGMREELNMLDALTQHLFYPCLDRMLSELDNRFSSIKPDILNGIQACNPQSKNFLSSDLHALAKHYKIELQQEEVLVAKKFLSRKYEVETNFTMNTLYDDLDPLMFPTLKKVIQIVLTIPVSSCSCERSFSVLRRLHNWLRQTMGQSRLNHLAILSVEKKILNSITDEAVIDRFANKHKRRHLLVHKK